MLKTRLLQAVCTVAMLAAVPAFAQSNTPPAGTGSTGPGGADNKAGMMPADNTGSGGPTADDSHATHRSARGHRGAAMHTGKGAASQDSAVDQLNDQSYAAAQKGQAFTGGGGGSDQGSAGMTKPGGSGDMNAMPGGSMPDSGAAGQGTKP
jgi:hypothetical protein